MYIIVHKIRKPLTEYSTITTVRAINRFSDVVVPCSLYRSFYHSLHITKSIKQPYLKGCITTATLYVRMPGLVFVHFV
jgi:hypothetical protein